MSLSFVSSAVLSSTDGVSHNDEKPIESSEAKELRTLFGRNVHKPLFDQLRSNQDAEKEAYDEMTRSMRGTRTLDEEDCAHLDSIEDMKDFRDREVKRNVEDEVAFFRAARADRQLGESSTVSVENDEASNNDFASESKLKGVNINNGIIENHTVSSVRPLLVPVIKKRKRRKQETTASEETSLSTRKGTKKLSNQQYQKENKSGNLRSDLTKTETTGCDNSFDKGNSAITRGKDTICHSGTIEENPEGTSKADNSIDADASKDKNDNGNTLDGLLGGYGSDSSCDSN